MARWADLEREAPEVAHAGWRLLTVPGVGFGYLATVRPDGGPHIHPVNPFLLAEDLAVLVVPSPKLADLRRDGRFALHSCGTADEDDEFFVAGTARECVDPALRAVAVAGYHGPVGADHVLMLLEPDRALWAHYTRPPTWPPTYARWRAGSAAARPSAP